MRLIDADAFKKQWTIASPEPYNTDAAEVLASINEAPTIDAVPIVRCKDCVNGNKDRGFFLCCSSGMVTNEDDFCSYGERKNDGI